MNCDLVSGFCKWPRNRAFWVGPMGAADLSREKCRILPGAICYSQSVGGAENASTAAVEEVSVDHRGAHVLDGNPERYSSYRSLRPFNLKTSAEAAVSTATAARMIAIRFHASPIARRCDASTTRVRTHSRLPSTRPICTTGPT